MASSAFKLVRVRQDPPPQQERATDKNRVGIYESNSEHAVAPITNIADRYEQSFQETNRQLLSLFNNHTRSLISELSRYQNAPFAGRIVRNCEGKPVSQLFKLPPWIVPMYAPFREPFVSDWLDAFKSCVDYLRCYNDQEINDGEGTVMLIPIHSPGGDVSLLRAMLAQLDAFRSEKHGGTPVKVVTYAVGQVASCAFCLHAAGDIALCASDAELMCHEPAFAQQIPVGPDGTALSHQQLEEGDQSISQLLETKNLIYGLSEVRMLLRYARKVVCAQIGDHGPITEECAKIRQRMMGADGITEKVKWRQHWYASHQAEIEHFRISCRRANATTESMPEYTDIDRRTIYEFITEKLAKNHHSKFIPARWAWLLDLCDASGVDIHYSVHEDFELHKGATFETQLQMCS